jgi:superfamily II DNA helicase RecQ
MMISVDPILKTIIIAAFATFHAFVPKDWQLEIVAHLLKTVVDGPPGPTPILICRPTGGGKSAVRDCAGFILGGGVVLTVVPLLAVAGDQTSKVRRASNREGNIRVYNLDEYKNYRKKTTTKGLVR